MSKGFGDTMHVESTPRETNQWLLEELKKAPGEIRVSSANQPTQVPVARRPVKLNVRPSEQNQDKMQV